MKKILLCTVLLSSTCLALPEKSWFSGKTYSDAKTYVLEHIKALGFLHETPETSQSQTRRLSPFEQFLHQRAPDMSMAVLEKVSQAVHCAHNYANDTPILTVIDYSLPSNQKRLWIFDLRKKSLLFHTHVSHGINSGELMTDYFSNVNNSKASSLGIYMTGAAYYGREGISLRLEGLDKGFNDQANNRYIVMHGGWYMDEAFIKKYGRAGRSWGCPALPLQYSKDIIQTIKEKNLMVVYYPDDDWFAQSKYLNCDAQSALPALKPRQTTIPTYPQRDPVLFTSVQYSRNPEENQVVLVMSADAYQKHFHKTAPLSRMLRRQIEQMEYVALSPIELNQLIEENSVQDKQGFQDLYFVTPVIKMVRGYYETLMQIRDLGQIQDIKPQAVQGKSASLTGYRVYLKNKPVLDLSPSEHFVRWLGL